MADDPTTAPKDVPEPWKTDVASSPSSEREVSELQQDQSGSPALQDPDIDRDAVQVLPGTGDYTDDGAVDVDPGAVHIPRHPDADAVGPVAGRQQADPDAG